VLENEFGPRKSCKLLGNDAVSLLFFAPCHGDEHILQCGCCCHAVYIWLVSAVLTLLSYDRVLENASGVAESLLKVLEFFVTKSRNRECCIDIYSACSGMICQQQAVKWRDEITTSTRGVYAI